MIPKSESEAIINSLKNVVNQCLEADISRIAGECVQFRVENDVYKAYTPTQYVRRKSEGGIADPRMYSYDVDSSTHTLTVSDNRHEVEVVESGVGYTWERSLIYQMQPYPRPYFDKAEEDVYSDGEAEAALVRAVQSI